MLFRSYWAGAEFADEPDGLTVTTKVAVEEHDDEGVEGEDDSAGDADGDPDVVMRYSAVEVLRDKDFADYTKEELLELSHLMRQMRIGGAYKASRRMVRSSARSGRPDLRRTVRRALANDGEPIHRAFRVRSEQRRRVVLLLDISGSMESYSRALLRFVHATVLARGRVEAFSLGTRLTQLTREMQTLDPDREIGRAHV